MEVWDIFGELHRLHIEKKMRYLHRQRIHIKKLRMFII